MATIHDRQYQSFEKSPVDSKWRRNVKDDQAATLLQQIIDGPLNVFLDDPTPRVQEFNEINAVVSASRELLNSYTVPVGKKFKLKQIDCGGDNMATYELEINSVLKSRKRTYFAGPFDVSFKFGDDNGIEYAEGTTIKIYVEHQRPSICDFDSTIMGSLANA